MSGNISITLVDDGTPIFIQIYEAIKNAIQNGSLEDGVFLPATRQLAMKLGVSRHTVLKSVKLLVTQGYVDSSEQSLRVKASPEVISCRPASPSETNPSASFARDPEAITAHQAIDSLTISQMDFSPERKLELSKFAAKAFSKTNNSTSQRAQEKLSGPHALADSELDKQWHRILTNQTRAKSCLSDAAVDTQGNLRLREAVARYLNCFRSLRCEADRLLVFSTRSAALDFVFRLVLDPGQSVITENPGAIDVRKLLNLHGADICTVDVDKFGMRTQLLNEVGAAKLVYTASAHNLPTGATLSLERRRELLAWAKSTNAYILEDSLDSDYWHIGRPVPAVQGLDESDCVFHLSSFSQILSPLCDLNFLVVPAGWKAAALSLINLLDPGVSFVEQQVLAELVERGLVERQLRKNFRELAQRRSSLVVALIKGFGAKVSVSRESSGSHIFVRFDDSMDLISLENMAAHAGLPLTPISSFYVGSVPRLSYVIPFDQLSAEELTSRATRFSEMYLSRLSQPSIPQILVQESHEFSNTFV